MTKPRPPIAKHTNQTGIFSPSLPAPDRGARRPTPGSGSGSRPVKGKAPIATSVSRDPDTLGRGTPGMAQVRPSRRPK